MDYGASIHDGDDAVGASPWGNSPASSPRNNNRTSFGHLGSEDPPPLRFSTQSSNGFGQDPEAPEGFQRPGTATTSSETEGEPEPAPSTGAPQEPQVTESQAAVPQPRAADSAPAEQPAPSEEPRRPSKPLHKLQAKVTGLERTGKKDPIIRFDVHTNLPRFRTTQYRDVRRLHSEFVKLAEHLISANPEAIVPAVPPPVTSAGAGNEEDEARVKALMQRWFNYVCSNEILMKDDEMVLFVESDFGYSPLVKMKQPATGVRRKILKQFAPPPDDTVELAEARPTVKLFYLGSMDAGHKVDKLVKARRGLALAEGEYGHKLATMNVQEPHPGLANAYRKLGKAVQSMGDYHAAQATAEATTIGDPFQMHSEDAFTVKETLTNRQILMREFIQAQEATRSKLNAADRIKASSNVRRDKVDEAIAALDEARQLENFLHAKTTSVTQNLVHERRKWFKRTADDMRGSIRDFVVREIEAERRILALLESVRPDIRAIDASGGLSRLGREAHPTIRRSSLAASQGPKGDAWSGAPRRSDAINRSSSSSFISKVPEEAEAENAPENAPTQDLPVIKDEDDDDRIDARNAASRLATSTF